MFASIVSWLEGIAQSVPLPVFVMVGGVVEEIIAPIPSPLVSTSAGGILQAQGFGIPYLLFICLLATITKTLSAYIFYVIGDKLEDLAVPRFGKYIGVSHAELEYFGKKFTGTRKDDLILTVIRAIPVMPSTPVSLLCGILKVNVLTFFVATFVGFYIRNLCFMLLGYTGLNAAESLMTGLDSAEKILQIVIVGGVVAVLGWHYWKRRKA